MLRKFSFVLFVILVFTFYFLHSSTSVSAQTWSTPAKINPNGQQAILPVTVTGPNGYLHTAWAAWSDNETPMYWNGVQNLGIYYSYWNGDSWSTPVKVSQNTSFAGFPSIAVTSDNKIHLVWEDDSPSPSGSYGRILYSTSTNYGQTWSTPISATESLDSLNGAWAWYPQIVSDTNNNIHLSFSYYNNVLTNDDLSLGYYAKWNGSSWSAPEEIQIKSSHENINNMYLAVDTSNNPHIVIREDGQSNLDPDFGIWYTGYNGTSWSSPTKLSTNGEWPRIIVDGANNKHIIWTVAWWDYVNDIVYNNVEYIKDSGAGWSAPTLITTNANNSRWFYPIIGLTFDTANNVYVGWGEQVGWLGNPKKGVQVRYRKWTASTQTWGSPFDMRLTYDLDTPFLYKDKWDNQHLAWVEENSSTGVWELWYSTVPVNIQTYNPASAFSMTLGTTSDTLTIPSGSYATSVSVSAQIGPLPASFNPTYTTLPRSYTFRPHGLTFVGGNKVAKATINYLDSEVMGTDERNMKVYVWDGNLNAWSTSFDSSTNTSQNKTTVTLPHFSLYGMTAPKIETQFQTPSSEVSGSTISVSYKLINLATGQPADPPAQRTVEDTTDPENPTTSSFWDEYKAKIVNNQGSVVAEISYLPDNSGSLKYDTANNNYYGNFENLNLPTGQYKLEVYLATIKVGEMNINYSSAGSIISVNFLPPLTTQDIYAMQDGSTLPFKFNLSQDGTVVTDQKNVQVKISNVGGDAFEKILQPVFDPGEGKYQTILQTKELGMDIGEYKGEVLLESNLLGSINFSILQEGKAKGKL